MGRYILTVAKNCPRLLDVERGVWPYLRRRHLDVCFSFRSIGPLVDKIGGKKGILIAAFGAAAANMNLGVITWLALIIGCTSVAGDFFSRLRAEYVFPELRRGFDHQGEGTLVHGTRAGRFRRHSARSYPSAFISPSMGPGHHQHDQGASASHARPTGYGSAPPLHNAGSDDRRDLGRVLRARGDSHGLGGTRSVADQGDAGGRGLSRT